MTLKDILQEYNKDFSVIEYRKFISIDSNDVDTFVGFCCYKNNELLTLDDDTYSLTDNIMQYQLYKPDWLVVWEENE